MRAKTECKECQGIQDAIRDEDNNPVYICRCCGAVTPRRVNNCKKRNTKSADIEATINSLLNGGN